MKVKRLIGLSILTGSAFLGECFAQDKVIRFSNGDMITVEPFQTKGKGKRIDIHPIRTDRCGQWLNDPSGKRRRVKPCRYIHGAWRILYLDKNFK